MDVVAAYNHLTDAIGTATGLSRPMLHVHAGMAIYLLTQVLLGERRGSVVALSMVLLAGLGNEVMNRLHWGSWRWDDTGADIVATLFWPVLCAAASAFGRWRWQGRWQRRGPRPISAAEANPRAASLPARLSSRRALPSRRRPAPA